MSSVLILTKQSIFDYETKRLHETFLEKNISVKIAHPDDFDIIVSKNLKQGIKYFHEDFPLPKVVLLRTGAGVTPFQLSVLRYFEQQNILCINSSTAVEIAKDKMRSSQILSANDVAIPTTMIIHSPVESNFVEKNIGFPCIIKVVTGSYGEGIYLCEKKKDYKQLLEFIETLGNKKTLIVQEYLGEKPGEDLRVFVIGNKVIGAMKRIGAEGDFRANIARGGTGENFTVTSEIEEIALKAAKSIGLSIAGVDLLFDKRGFRVVECNSNPGFEGFEQYTQMNVANAITDYIIEQL